MLDWNDLRYFLAVARQGSTLAAGRDLRVSQTTVARRIAALEEALGFPLFHKRQAGYSLTPVGEELVAKAEKVEQSAAGFVGAADAHTRDLGGVVCLTTHEMIAVTLLVPFLRELHDRHPDIVIDIDTREDVLDLGKGEADIALRSTSKSKQPDGVVGRRICLDDWTLYCSRDYAAQHGLPQAKEDLHNHSLIGGGGPALWRQYLGWVRELGLEENVTLHYPSPNGLLAGVRSGLGIAVLPCIVADADPDLLRCFPPRKDHERTLWLLTHERVSRSPRVRAVIDLLYEFLNRNVRDMEQSQAATA
ncbi:MAG: LysR family transcriptional regulator [Sphingomicrobium sp.]